MHRGAKRAKAKVKAKRPLARKSLKNADPRVRDLEKRLAKSLEREQATVEILQEKDRALTEALDQQTATSEILRVIASSPTDLQPVLDAVAENAARVCGADDAIIHRIDGEVLWAVAHYGPIPLFPPIGSLQGLPIRGSITGRAVLEGRAIHIADVAALSELELPVARRNQQLTGQRTTLAAPLLRESVPIGTILIRRLDVRPFTDEQIEMLKTFADQAVIAIENVRLFKELQARTGELTQSVEKLTALGEVSRAVSSTLDVETVLNTIVSRASQLAGADGCAIYEYDEATQTFHVRATHNYDARFVETLRTMPLRRGEGVMGRATETREPTEVADIAVPGAYQSQVRDVLVGAGFRAVLSVPLLREEQVIGSLSLNRKAPGEFSPEVIDVLKTFATQSALAIQNARLFREIADKSA
jgi:GAF domain-containing protein